jgi:hypothetical protein
MNRKFFPIILASIFLLAACGQDTGESDSVLAAKADYLTYEVIDQDLEKLRNDFNAHQGQVRLVFISGPTCGICLRGMADLNDEFIAASQTDGRLETFVIHVPALGAKEEHVPDVIPLLAGPRIHHYWEESGIIGRLYQKVMDTRFYIWDFWMVYGPDVVWDGELPPEPDYWMHQLGPLPRELMLDAEVFAAETKKRVDLVGDAASFAGAPIARSAAEQVADGLVIPVIAQPKGFAIGTHIRGRGGYLNLKSIQSIEQRGTITAGEKTFDLQINSQRDHGIRRLVGAGEQISEAGFDGNSVSLPEGDNRGLPAALERILLESFEFDDPVVEWKDKGHKTRKIGMHKHGDVLAWGLELIQASGTRWNLLIDSHNGNIVKAIIVDESDAPVYVMVMADFYDEDGFRFPHTIEYYDGNENLLAVEKIDEIFISRTEAEVVPKDLTH